MKINNFLTSQFKFKEFLNFINYNVIITMTNNHNNHFVVKIFLKKLKFEINNIKKIILVMSYMTNVSPFNIKLFIFLKAAFVLLFLPPRPRRSRHQSLI